MPVHLSLLRTRVPLLQTMTVRRRGRLAACVAALGLLFLLPSEVHASVQTYVSGAASPTGGGWETSSAGQVGSYGGEVVYGSLPASTTSPAVGMASTSDGKGYWIATASGSVSAFGDAAAYGQQALTATSARIVAITATSDRRGYWLAAADGHVYPFGDAHFFGMPTALSTPIVGMATPSFPGGYWLLASNGAVLSFGQAHYYGEGFSRSIARPIVGMASTSDGRGYRLAESGGAVLAFGDASSSPSSWAPTTGTSVVGIAAQPSNTYTLLASNGSFHTVQSSGAATSGLISAGAATSGPDPTANAAQSSLPFPVGIDLGHFGWVFEENPDAQQQQALVQTLQAIKASGFTSVRIDVSWTGSQPGPGPFVWPQESLVKQIVAAGVDVDAILDYTPTWAALQDGSPNPALYAKFAAAAVSHFAPLGVHTYELENEENLQPIPPTTYAQLLQMSYPGIKQVDPQSTVLLGGLGPAADSSTSFEPATYLSDVYASGGGGYFDGVAVHPYSTPVAPSYAASWNPFYNLPQLHQISVANGFPNTKIWVTEYGAPTAGPAYYVVSEAQQEAFATAAYQEAKTWPWIGAFYYFDWQDSPYDGDSSDWGLTRADGTPKPALNAIRSMLGMATSDDAVPAIASAS